MAKSEEELKSLLMKVKEESEKVSLKLNIQKTKIMASSPITSWQIDGKTMETVADFILGGSKITADGDSSHKVKRHLLLGRKVMTNLDSILKRRDITLPTKLHLVKAVDFPIVIYGCESWTMKYQRVDAFELWCWRRLLRVPWTSQPKNLLTWMCFCRNLENAGNRKAMLRALKTLRSLRSLKMATRQKKKKKESLGLQGDPTSPS